jgi:hypothetical protein
MEELRACGSEVPGATEDERAGWLRLLGEVAYEAVDDAERAALYRQAMDIAAAHGQPTLYIHLLLVRLLLDMGDRASAKEELRSCEREIPYANEDDRAWWVRLFDEARQTA